MAAMNGRVQAQAQVQVQPAEDDNTGLIITQLYNPEIYSQILPQRQQGFTEVANSNNKPKRRRRKNKGKDETTSSVGLKKRKLSAEQVSFLEMNFGNEHKLESERKDRLASELGLDPRQVAVWFQNRRARWKNKKLEQEFDNLQKSHDSVVLEKSYLQSQVSRLEEELIQAKKEIQQMLERGDGNSSNSPSSSMTVEAMEPPYLGDQIFTETYEDLFYYVQENNNYSQGMDWVNLYI